MGAAAAAARRRRRASSQPTEAPFSGFVFKIQANMDPRHRDRIAFFRVCSGRYQPGMKVRHLRAGARDEDRQRADVHGQRARRERGRRRRRHHRHPQPRPAADRRHADRRRGARVSRAFRTSRPSSSASRARAIRSRPSSCRRACRSSARKARSRCSRRRMGNTLLLGAVGPLQFEVVAHRLASEYKVDAIYETAGIATARWLTFPDDATRRNFEREQRGGARDRRRRQPGVPRHATSTTCR